MSEEIPGMDRAREVVMAEEPAAVAPASATVTTTTVATGGVIATGEHEKEQILRTLQTVATILSLGLVCIAIFSIYLQTLPEPREAGSSVGAIRENIVGALMAVLGALIMKIKGGATS